MRMEWKDELWIGEERKDLWPEKEKSSPLGPFSRLGILQLDRCNNPQQSKDQLLEQFSFIHPWSSHPSWCKVGVLGNVGKVLELQSLPGCRVAHDDLTKKIIYSYSFFDDLAKRYLKSFAACADLTNWFISVLVSFILLFPVALLCSNWLPCKETNDS